MAGATWDVAGSAGWPWASQGRTLGLSLLLSPWSQEEQMRQKDSRARLTSSVLRTMRTIKSHGWEEAFLERVLRIRGQELGALRTSTLLFSVSLVSFQVSTFLVMSPVPLQSLGWGGRAQVGTPC